VAYGPDPMALATSEIEESSRSDSDLDSTTSRPRYGHSHVFPANPATEIPDSQRGRKRRLTEEEREHTLKVRTLGACWACHLSKTRCSPCRPGSPCEQCTRLLNKRRFYHLSCFNDPIETLNIFLTPGMTDLALLNIFYPGANFDRISCRASHSPKCRSLRKK